MAAKRGGIIRGLRRGPTVRYTLHGLVGRSGSGVRQKVPRITLSRIRSILLKSFADISDDADAARPNRLVVLLLTRPGLPLFESEILPNVNYWHSRTGDHLDIFCVGFAGTGRDFSNRSFVQTLARLETMSKWRYGGESELLLVNVKPSGTRDLEFGWSTAVVVPLEEAVAVGAIRTVPAFMERLIRYAEAYNHDDPSWGFSDSMAGQLSGAALKNMLLSFVPKSARDEAKKAFIFAVRDLRRRQR